MKTLGLVNTVGVLSIATGAVFVAPAAKAATCLFNEAGVVTRVISSDSYKRMRAPADRHRGLAAVMANRHGNVILFNGAVQHDFSGLGFDNEDAVYNHCGRARAQGRDPVALTPAPLERR